MRVFTALDSEEVTNVLHSSWKFSEDKLSLNLRFNNFFDAFEFMTKVANVAEEQKHHPDWSNSYAKVNIDLTTHDYGGVTDRDIILAKEIDQILQVYSYEVKR